MATGTPPRTQEARGLGLMSGIEFQQPAKVTRKLSFKAFSAIHPGMFGQMLVMRLFQGERVLTQMCGNDFLVLKVAPLLAVSEEHLNIFVAAVDRVVGEIHSSN